MAARPELGMLDMNIGDMFMRLSNGGYNCFTRYWKL